MTELSARDRILGHLPTIALALAGALVFGGLLAMSFLSRPIADDYGAFAKVDANGFGVLWLDYSTLSSRFANIVVYAVPYLLLGERALWVVPVLMVLAVTAAGARLGWRCAPASSRGSGTVVGAVVALVTIIAQVSLFDVLAWYTSSTLYLASVAALWVLAMFVVEAVVSTGRRRVVALAFAAFTAFVIQGLSETIAIPLLGAALVITIACAVIRRWRVQLRTVAILAGASVAGFLLAMLAPGRTGRMSVQMSGDFIGVPAILSLAAHDVVPLILRMLGPAALLGIAAGLALGRLLPRSRPRTLVLWATGAVLIAVAEVFSTSALVRFGYNGGAVPARSLAVAVAVVMVAIVIVVAVLTNLLVHRWRVGVLRAVTAVVVALACCVFLVAWKTPASDVLVAESLRAAALEARASQIAAQLADGQDVIEVLPLPILLPDSETSEYLLPGSSGPAWTEPEIDAYYGIADRETRSADQAPTYCRAGMSLPFWAIRSCEELAAG